MSSAQDWRDLAINMVLASEGVSLDHLAEFPTDQLLRLLSNRETVYRLLERSAAPNKRSKMVDIALSEIADIALIGSVDAHKQAFVKTVRQKIDDFVAYPDRFASPYTIPVVPRQPWRPRPKKTPEELAKAKAAKKERQAAAFARKLVREARLADIVMRRDRGESFAEIGKAHGIVRERVRQILMQQERRERRAKWLQEQEEEAAQAQQSRVRPFPLSYGALDTRIWNAMINDDCTSLVEFAKQSDAEMLRIPNLGRKSIKRVRELTDADREDVCVSDVLSLHRGDAGGGPVEPGAADLPSVRGEGDGAGVHPAED